MNESKTKNNKGFTLAEMLIVVAIIGVLIAIVTISISNSLERAREAADLANIRQICSELKVVYMFDDNIPAYFYNDTKNNRIRACIKCQGKTEGWQTKGLQKSGTGVVICEGVCYGADTKKPYLSIYIDKTTGAISFLREDKAKTPLYN